MTCPTPIAFADAVDYWTDELSDADVDRLEAHAFACASCARELAAAGALAGSIAVVARDGRLHGVVTDAILNRLAADGVRIRMFTLDGPGVVPCAVWAGDDLVVSRIRADFTGIDTVSIVTRLASGEEIGRVADIPVHPGQHEILNAFSAAHLRALPATRVDVAVTAFREGHEQPIAEYTLEHAGAFDRSAGAQS
jgi:hypothetical protein